MGGLMYAPKVHISIWRRSRQTSKEEGVGKGGGFPSPSLPPFFFRRSLAKLLLNFIL